MKSCPTSLGTGKPTKAVLRDQKLWTTRSTFLNEARQCGAAI